ncbi:pantetheine-phosphate adenylyltransferase [Moraxella catarrhalis 12P80B1]|nr:pantetheine-phosphate adenylyltransferase [Moraxella catarrhalis 12P80B1]
MVREVAKLGGDVSKFVPESVLIAFEQKFNIK